MELSRPVVVQHQGYLTLTLDFQGQILKCCMSGMGGPIHGMKSQEWEGRSTWNERDMSRYDVIPIM